MYMAAVQNGLNRLSFLQENSNKADIPCNMIYIALSEHGFQTNVKTFKQALADVRSNGRSCMNAILQSLRHIAENKFNTVIGKRSRFAIIKCDFGNLYFFFTHHSF